MDFSKIYDEYFDRIYAYICCRAGYGTTAEDIAALVFQKALAKFAQYDPARGNISQWLFGIARNETNCHLRFSALRRFLPLDILQESLAAKDATAFETLSARQDTAVLTSALEMLTARERDLITLKFYSEMTNREIADVSGLSESNIGTILYRAMGKLRQAFVEGANGIR